MIKNWRIFLWIAAASLAIFVIFFGVSQGFVVTTSSNSDILQGDVISAINNEPVTEENLARNYTGLVEVDTQRGTIFVDVSGKLPFTTEIGSSTNLNFGLDVEGGISAIVKPTDESLAEEIIPVLEDRINFYGLREATFRTINFQDETFVEIAISGGNREEIRQLLETEGKFESKIPLTLRNGTLNLDTQYEFSINNEMFTINEITYGKNESFTLDGIDFVVGNITNNEAIIIATVYRGEDIKAVYLDPSRASILQRGNSYVWDFSIELSQKGAKNFALITDNVPSTGRYLASQIQIYLDDTLVNSFDISSTLKGREHTTIQISGGAANFEEAVDERRRITSVLRSGSLPTSIEILQINQISPTLGSSFIGDVFLAGIGAAIGISIITLLRYRRPKITVPMIIVSLSEVLIILGSSVLFNWTLDLAAMVGIVAAVGTGIDSQLIIIDQSIRNKEETMKEKLKKAFFVIFGAGGILIASMIPLLGIGALRGFAITTIIGVLVGILITRPAFGEIIKSLIEE